MMTCTLSSSAISYGETLARRTKQELTAFGRPRRKLGPVPVHRRTLSLNVFKESCSSYCQLSHSFTASSRNFWQFAAGHVTGVSRKR